MVRSATPDDRATHLTDPISIRAHSGARFGNRATGSTVVTARSDEGPADFLGLFLPTMLRRPAAHAVSIDKRTSALRTILAARHFALNFLPREPSRSPNVRRQGTAKGRRALRHGRWGPFAWRTDSA